MKGHETDFLTASRVFREVVQDYKARTGRQLPFCLRIVRDHDQRNQYYTTYRTVHLSKRGRINKVIAEHELGHAIRYNCDGSENHFRSDWVKYRYDRTHSCDSRRPSEEAAFNEGWAFFWADECYHNTDRDLRRAGDVADALRSLQSRCNTNFGGMVRVLCENPRKIHTYRDFDRFHQRLYGCS